MILMKNLFMKIPDLPENPKEWSSELICELSKFVNIESESFDFKLEPNKLYEDFCAMANVKGGFIILGIDEVKNSGKVVEFIPEGFDHGKQDEIGLKVGDSIVNVEPLPEVILEHIEDGSRKKFFTVIKITSKTSDRPYFVKGTDQCFARIQNSSRRIGRTAILNLYSYSYEQRKNIEHLRSSTYYLKEELELTLKFLNAISPDDLSNTPPVDLSFIRNVVLSTELFLEENNLFHVNSQENFPFVFHKITLLNSYIEKFNSSTTSIRKDIKAMLTTMNYVYQSDFNQISKFLDKVIACADKHLKKYQ